MSSKPAVLNVSWSSVLVLASVLASVLATGCVGSGCADPLPTSDVCRDPATRFAVDQILPGKDRGDGFEPFTDGEVFPVVYGGQGTAMLEMRTRLVGADVPSCAELLVEIYKDRPFELAGQQRLPMRTYEDDDGRVTGTMWVFLEFRLYGGEPITVRVTLGDTVGEVRIVSEGNGYPDAGLPDAGVPDAWPWPADATPADALHDAGTDAASDAGDAGGG